ncbi:protein kinase, partial [uncultured Propionibacterium sp.]|uniref:protein kinase domain-containing protein n=1 Tax=uncultured Propionibacterium sp. TaxID=218066 RepID=UPI002931EF14
MGHVLDDRYEILQKLARGGMATVYRAQDLRLGRIVAVKVMHDDLDESQDTDFARKFDREARAAAALTDSHVVGVFDQGIDQGRPYIVMEFVEGCTLRNLITREAPFDPERALSLIEPVAAALAAAHDSGLVHRDVKPENVLIGGKGQIKVADFGLARAASAKTITVAKGNVIGTVSYLPPEIVAQTHADARSDIYSTGIVLYELLTGEKPYTGENLQIAYAHVNRSVPAPSQTLRRNGHAPVPDYVDALVVACTRRDPDRRPADGHDLLTRVRRARAAVAEGVTHDESLAMIMYPAGWRESRTRPGAGRVRGAPADTEPIRLSSRAGRREYAGAP